MDSSGRERWEDGCPVCFAPPDEVCRTPAGKPRNDHKARPKKPTGG